MDSKSTSKSTSKSGSRSKSKTRFAGVKRRTRNSSANGTNNTNTSGSNRKLTRKVARKEPESPLTYAGIPFYFITHGNYNALIGKEDGLRAVILDNDETTGYYQGEFKDYIRENKETPKPYNEVIDDLTKLLTGENKLGLSLLRPGYEVFFKKLRELKDAGRLDAVIMYTNMEKKDTMKIEGIEYNRPQLLASVFDKIAASVDRQLFDLLIFRDRIAFPNSENKIRARTEKYIAVINKIFMVEGKTNKYLFLDDKPELIYNNNSKSKVSNAAYGVNEHTFKSKKSTHIGIAFNNLSTASSKSIIDKLEETFS